MVGSSLRNSIHRRNHKERGQLANRSKLGLLEKHKDYVQRARDYNSKKDRIKRLKEKASLKNKDEFYFGMVNGKTDKGVHIQSRGNVALPVEMVKLLKTQDANYVRTQRAVGQNKILRLKAQLASITDLLPGTSSSSSSSSSNPTAAGLGSDSEDDADMSENELNEAEQATLRAVGLLEAEKKTKGKGKGRATPRKIIFKETKEEVRNYTSSTPFASTSTSSSVASSSRQQPTASTSTSTTPDLGWIEVVPKADIKKAKRDAKKALLSSNVTSAEQLALDAEARKLAAKKHRLLLLRTLQSHLTRDSSLSAVEKEMALQRALMGKGAKKRLSKGGREVAQDGDGEGDDEEDDERGGKKGEWRGRTFKWKAERRK